MLFQTLRAALIWSKKDDLKFRLEYSSSKQADITFCSIKEMYRSVLWTLWERERVGRFGRMALKHV